MHQVAVDAADLSFVKRDPDDLKTWLPQTSQDCLTQRLSKVPSDVDETVGWFVRSTLLPDDDVVLLVDVNGGGALTRQRKRGVVLPIKIGRRPDLAMPLADDSALTY